MGIVFNMGKNDFILIYLSLCDLLQLHILSSIYCNIKSHGTCTVYPKKYAHGFYFAVLCCGYTLTDFPIPIRLTSLALWQSNDCPSASKATLMNMDKYFMWIHYERLHNHNKAKHNKTRCIFLGIYCTAHNTLFCSFKVKHWIQVSNSYLRLNQCGPVTSYGNKDLVTHWFKLRLVTLCHHAIA